jgi:hypothetical protein
VPLPQNGSHTKSPFLMLAQRIIAYARFVLMVTAFLKRRKWRSLEMSSIFSCVPMMILSAIMSMLCGHKIYYDGDGLNKFAVD